MLYIALSIIVIYLLFIFIKFKQIPNSISDTYYLGANWIFTAVMWAVGLSTSISLLNISDINYLFLAFLTGAGLLFVGTAPHFKETLEGKVHYGGAIIFALSSNIWAALLFSPWILLSWITAILWYNKKQRVFWAEIVCIFNLIIAYALS